ncbi:MAG: enamine deaminase RidA (YjgF/YER057c/UK114 family) [Pseudohongiellaceae bacterium]|jgi:enamine deaminase RidA (YjgF/YER057c/UK114 family)
MANKKEEVTEQTADTVEAEEAAAQSGTLVPRISNFNMILITGFGMAIVIIIVMLAGGEPVSDMASAAPVAVESSVSAPTASTLTTPSSTNSSTTPTAVTSGDVNVGGIERKGEGRHFYTTIKIPANAETLYLSGSGASRNEDGSWGDMEAQVEDTFNSFRDKLEAEGWSMSDIVQVRAFAVSDEYGLLDFDGFNRGYRKFFGTEENPMKPVRSFVEIAGLVVPGWLVEIEIRAAKLP